MDRHGVLTKVLAVTGAGLVLFPIIAPLLMGFAALAQMGRYLVDYLMPGELFPLVLLGGALLAWSARRARFHPRWYAWGIGLVAGFLVLTLGLAQVTGVANDVNAEQSAWFPVVVGSFILFDLAVVGLGVLGVLLVRDVFTNRKPLPNA